jgi:hypothetical protein
MVLLYNNIPALRAGKQTMTGRKVNSVWKKEFSMKNLVKLFGLIALTVAIVFSMAACGSTGSSPAAAQSNAASDGVSKTLVITGIDGFSGDVLVTIASDGRNLTGSMVAIGGAAISGNRLSVPLVQSDREDRQWTGIGEYFIVLILKQGSNDVIYFYSQGGMSALRYNITEATTTIAFNQFRRL